MHFKRLRRPTASSASAISASTSPTAGSSATVPQIRQVAFSGDGVSSPCAPDPFYARLALGAPNCTFTATAFMDWGSRPLPSDGGQYEATIQVGSGTPQALGGTPVGGVGPWIASGIPIAKQGPLDVHDQLEVHAHTGPVGAAPQRRPSPRQAPDGLHRCEAVRPERVDRRSPRQPRGRPDRRDGLTERAGCGRQVHDGPDDQQRRAALGGNQHPRQPLRHRRPQERLPARRLRRAPSAGGPAELNSIICDPYWEAAERAGRVTRRSTSAASRRTRRTTPPPSFWWNTATGSARPEANGSPSRAPPERGLP